ncbi:MAG: hypothetical protein ACT4N4_10005 [Rhodospirillales bacterium]
MPSMTFGLAAVAAGCALAYAIIYAGTERAASLSSRSLGLPDRWAALVVAGLWLLIAVCFVLWLHADGNFYTRDVGESNAVYLTATNARSFASSLLADQAASPDPAAHPYLYTHHPGIVQRYVSIALIHLGVGFEGQILAALIASALGLAVAYVALQRMLSSAYAALFVMTTAASYWFYFYAAGDLYRGYLLNLFWLILLGLSRNPRLDRAGWNLFLGALSVLVTATDWSFTAFCLSFAVIWTVYENRRIHWLRLALVFAAPCVGLLIAHQALVIHTLGLKFWLFDVGATYFGRGGLERGSREAEWLQRYRDAHVVVWHASGLVDGRDFLRTLIGTLFASSGLLGVLYVFALPAMAVHAVAGRRWPPGLVVLIAVPAVAVLAGAAPFTAMAVPALAVALRVGLASPARDGDGVRVSAFGLLLLLAMLIESAVFPWYSFQLLLKEGRAPFGLLYSALFAVTGLFVMGRCASPRPLLGGALGSGFRQDSGIVDRLERWQGVLAIASLLLLMALAYVATQGWMIALVVFPLGLAWPLAAWAKGHRDSVETYAAWIGSCAQTAKAWPWVGMLWLGLRLFVAVGLAGLAAVLVLQARSLPPSLPLHLAVLALLAAGYALAAGLGPSHLKGAAAAIRARLAAGEARLGGVPDARCGRLGAALVAAMFALLVGWSAVVGVRFPPEKPPYGDLLSRPPYQGASFLTWTSSDLVWRFTRGWAYTPETIPPDFSKPNLRWRFFADWRDDAKYSRPQFFLCDQTRFRWEAIRGPEDTSGPRTIPEAGLQCKVPGRCTCEDVAAAMAKQGHKADIATPSYAIIRFVW